MVTAKQLQGCLVLLGNSLGHQHDLDALKVEVVVSLEQFHALWAAHRSVHLVEEGEGAFFNWNRWGGLQVNIVDCLTWDGGEGREKLNQCIRLSFMPISE